VNCYPFIEAEKARQRNVKRACGLLKVSCAALCAARSGQPPDRDHQVSRRSGLRRSPRSPPRPCNAFAAAQAQPQREDDFGHLRFGGRVPGSIKPAIRDHHVLQADIMACSAAAARPSQERSLPDN
jgi:hypothetical protein